MGLTERQRAVLTETHRGDAVESSDQIAIRGRRKTLKALRSRGLVAFNGATWELTPAGRIELSRKGGTP